MNFMKNLITTKATRNAVTSPTMRRMISEPLTIAPCFSTLYAEAATMVGIARKNENSTATDDDCRDNSDDNFFPERENLVLLCPYSPKWPELRPEIHNYCQYRPQLDDNIEHLCKILTKTNPLIYDDQMPR